MAVRTIVEPVAMTTNALEAHIFDVRLLLPYSWLWPSFSRRILSGTEQFLRCCATQALRFVCVRSF
jgi:hypothetical protein